MWYSLGSMLMPCFCFGPFQKHRFYMPEDVLAEIFSWLPPESLIRFKCVSKSWYALIKFLMKDSEFVNKHLRNIDKKLMSSTCLVFYCPGNRYLNYPKTESLLRDLFKSLTIFHNDNNRDHSNYVAEHFDSPVLPGKQDVYNMMAVHCDGIICQADYYGRVILCNPAIKQWKTLPKTCLKNGFFTIGVGFGYDARANDYKVVRFGCEWIPGGQGLVNYEKTKAEVYSMRAGCWREIGIDLEFARFLVRAKKCYCKGVFYWSMWYPMFTIVSFDMSNEVFHNIPILPNMNTHLTRKSPIKPTLTVWNETVALFLYYFERGIGVSFKLWVLDDCYGGVKGSYSWTEELVIGPLDKIAAPLAFLKNDDILVEAADGSLILYNPHKQVLTKRIQAVDTRCWEFSYVKSLVSVHVGSHSHS
ncbi:F-box domain containing protein [Parasponia andersonii]|uniref:F-box domain containing protein n=1 Tax=Parasponia andersonii TaxID=3476 RepID=A0A2P5AR85_PARAD|nr:F-box domain containing protein [Parasponia andersonii]